MDVSLLPIARLVELVDAVPAHAEADGIDKFSRHHHRPGDGLLDPATAAGPAVAAALLPRAVEPVAS